MWSIDFNLTNFLRHDDFIPLSRISHLMVLQSNRPTPKLFTEQLNDALERNGFPTSIEGVKITERSLAMNF